MMLLPVEHYALVGGRQAVVSPQHASTLQGHFLNYMRIRNNVSLETWGSTYVLADEQLGSLALLLL